MRTRIYLAFAGAAFASATAASATTCEESFARTGSVLSATTYTATQTVADLTVSDAVAQMHGIAVTENYDILEEDRAGGSMLIEQRRTSTRRAIPILIAVTRNGATTDILMTIRTPTGVFAGSDAMRTEMCRVLGQLRGGAEGRRLAAQNGQAQAANVPTVVTIESLSNEFARAETVNAAVIPARYQNRSWTVRGRLENVERVNGGWLVSYVTPPHFTNPLLGPTFSVTVTCDLAPNQHAWALTLRRGQTIRLTGQFADYVPGSHHLSLSNCVNTPR